MFVGVTPNERVSDSSKLGNVSIRFLKSAQENENPRFHREIGGYFDGVKGLRDSVLILNQAMPSSPLRVRRGDFDASLTADRASSVGR